VSCARARRRGDHLVVRTRGREVDVAQVLAEAEQVAVRIHEAGEHGASGEVDHACGRAAQRHRTRRIADEGEPVAAHGQRLGERARPVGGVDAGVEHHEVGRRRGPRAGGGRRRRRALRGEGAGGENGGGRGAGDQDGDGGRDRPGEESEHERGA
jgi:hypothetical protein